VKAKQKMSESNDGNINLDAMSLDQLDQLKQQEEGRLQVLTTRYSQLRAAAARLNAAQMAVSELSPALEGKEVMVALTGTLYVPGKILEPNKLLVDLGTGFYVEKTPKDTKAFLERKTKLVDANSENITTVVQVTRQNIEQVTMAMRGKLLEIRARQEGRMQRTIDAQKS
jgi:prefoldin alpha subunit